MLIKFFKQNIPAVDRFNRSIAVAIRISLALAMAGAVVSQQWTVLFVSALTLILTYLPGLIERNYHVYLPAEIEITIVVFIYAALFLGEVHGYYTKFWWWDVVLHAGSGIVFGFAGLMIILSLYEGGKIQASPIVVSLFAFTFSVAIGAIWEIFEFAMDTGLGFSMQRSGLFDTMWDLIIDSAGALITASVSYFYVKGGKTRLFEKLIRKTMKENPDIYS